MPLVSRGHRSTLPPMEVNPQDLLDSADQVERHARKLKTAHDAAHTLMEAAQAGWAGRSAVALQSLVAKWRAGTAAMTTDLSGHAEALRTAGLAYRDTDARAAEAVAQAGVELDAFGAQR